MYQGFINSNTYDDFTFCINTRAECLFPSHLQQCKRQYFVTCKATKRLITSNLRGCSSFLETNCGPQIGEILVKYPHSKFYYDVVQCDAGVLDCMTETLSHTHAHTYTHAPNTTTTRSKKFIAASPIGATPAWA